MARQKGMLNLSGNIEVNAGAPFDARDIVPTKADLTVASNFPYAYVGMETYVVAEDKKYRYMGGGVTDIENWDEVGGGGGGHTIQKDGIDMTSRAALNFVGMDVSDNSEEDSTDVEEHRLTSAEISEIMGGIPNPQPRYPVILDERGTEYIVGWYILANGTKKPVYEKTVDFGTLPNATTKEVDTGITNAKDLLNAFGFGYNSDHTAKTTIPRIRKDNRDIFLTFNSDLTKINILTENDRTSISAYITIQYTKTTDTPV